MSLGPNPEMENNPLYIDRALEKGYDVEVDIRGSFYTKFYLGHDEQQYMVSPEWLFERAGKLWLHAKDIQALHSLATGIKFQCVLGTKKISIQ